MNTRHVIILCWLSGMIFSLSLMAQTPGGDSFAISEKAKAKLVKEWQDSYPVHELDPSRKLGMEKAAEQWVSGRFDIYRAEMKESRLFPGRRVYRNKAEEKKGVKELFIRDRNYTGYEQEQHQNPEDLLARYPRKPRSKEEIAGKALKFLRNHNLVAESARDKIGEVIVRQKMRYLGGEQNAAGTEIIMTEHVRFVRHVDGRPVINSHLLVEFDAATGEVVALTQDNWVPLAVGTARHRCKTGKKPVEAAAWVRQRADKKFGSRAKTRLKDIKQAWYQTDAKLLPVLVCDVGAIDGDEQGAAEHSYTEIINLTDDPGIPDKWADLGVAWPQDPPAGYPNLDSYATYR